MEPESRKYLAGQMEKFFNGGELDAIEGYVPEDQRAIGPSGHWRKKSYKRRLTQPKLTGLIRASFRPDLICPVSSVGRAGD